MRWDDRRGEVQSQELTPSSFGSTDKTIQLFLLLTTGALPFGATSPDLSRVGVW